MPEIDYYRWVRREIQPLLPRNPSRILEVGAGAGGTLKWLKGLNPRSETTAVEINGALLPELKQNVDVPIVGSIDDAFPQLQMYDLILLLDILEHLTDPGMTLRKLMGFLAPEGRVIVSVPNMAHWRVSVPLLLQRRFEYQDAGVLDRTHLRFFVEDTAIQLLNDANITVIAGIVSGLQGRRSRLLDRLSFGALRHYLALQYIMLGELNCLKAPQQRIRWKVA